MFLSAHTRRRRRRRLLLASLTHATLGAPRLATTTATVCSCYSVWFAVIAASSAVPSALRALTAHHALVVNIVVIAKSKIESRRLAKRKAA